MKPNNVHSDIIHSPGPVEKIISEEYVRKDNELGEVPSIQSHRSNHDEGGSNE